MSRIDIQGLEQRLDEVRTQEGLIGGTLKVKAVKPDTGHLSAHINLRKWGAEFCIDPDWELDKRTRKYSEKKGVAEPIVEVGKDMIRHEVKHWDKCPYDIYGQDTILDSVNRALQDREVLKEATEEQREEITGYVANMFTDLVVNSNCRDEGALTGFPIFFYDQGTSNGGSFNPLYEFHVRLNLGVWGDKADRRLVSRFYTKDKDLGKKIKQLAHETKRRLHIGDLNLEETVSTLNDSESWSAKAYDFASLVAPLIQGGAPSEKLSPTSKYNKQPEREDLGPDPSSFDDEIKDRDNRKKIVLNRHNNGKPLPSYMGETEAFDYLYNALATEMAIKAKTQKDGWKLPLVTANEEPFNPEEHSPSDIDLSRLGVDTESKIMKNINFRVPVHHHTIQIPYSRGKERFPDIMYLFDASGSMILNNNNEQPEQTPSIPWGDESRYHFALLGVYGSLKWLQQKGIAPYIRYNTTLFGDTTRSSGWHDYSNIERTKQNLFNVPNSASTRLDTEVLQRHLKRDPAVVIMLSDGGIHNWGEVREDFRRISSPHYLSLVQMGPPTLATEDIKSWGKPIYMVENAEDMRGLIVDLTKQSTKKYLEALRNG